MTETIEKTVAAYQQGDRDAYRQLVTKYQNLVTSVAFARVGDLQRSEDIAQQAFLVAWQKKSELRSVDRFASWLRSITSNLARNEIRLKVNQKERAKADTLSAAEPLAETDPADRIVARQEQSRLLWSMVDHIPLSLREPLILYYREEKSVATIATQMELSEQAVKQRIHRARLLLKRELENHVENLLEATRPAPTFSAGVVAALPLTGSTLPAAPLGASITKAGSLFSITALSSLLGGVIGIAGGWWGVRKAAQHATSLEEESLLWRFFKNVLLLGLVFAVLMALLGTLANATLQIGLSVALVATYATILIVLTKRHRSQQNRLHQQFGSPKFHADSEAPTLSVRGFGINVLSAVLGSWIWMVLLAISQQSWWFTGLICVIAIANACCAYRYSSIVRTPIGRVRFQARMVAWLVILELLTLNAWNLVEGVRYAPDSKVYPIWIFNLVLIGMGLLLVFIFETKARRMSRLSEDSGGPTDP